MIRALAKWWASRGIGIAELEAAYWAAGVREAARRMNEYEEKQSAAEHRVHLLRQRITEIDYPTKHLKGYAR